MTVRKAKLLSRKEKSVCQSIVLLKKGLASKRAAVLLAVDAGLVQLEAARQAGLTIGQLRYALILFKNKKLAMFSAELRKSAASAPKKPTMKQKKVKAKKEDKSAKTKKAKKKKSKSKKSKAVKKSKGKAKKKAAKKTNKNKKSKKKK